MFRDTTAVDFPAILRLNRESEHFLSPLTLARLAGLHGRAAYHRVAVLEGDVLGFLLAFSEGSDYDSPNYRWFAARYDRFLYIDRVVVSKAHRGKRLGALLYEDLFSFAGKSGAERVVCEFDIDPPNAISRALHARFGFREVGTQWVAAGRKQVSLQEAPVSRWR
jgi:uncharacterized protein